MENKQHVIGFTAKNILRLTFAKFTFGENGKAVVAGDHGQGKTSLARAFIMTLLGKKEVPEDPVHHGAEEGETFLELDNFNVRMRVAPDRSCKVEVFDKEGGKYPQSEGKALLDGLMAERGCFPDDFLTMADKDRVNLLLKVKGVDLDAVNRKHTAIFEERTGINKELAKKKAELQAAPHHKDAPTEEMSTAAVLEEIDSANQIIRKAEDLVKEAELCTNQILDRDRRIKEAQELIARLEQEQIGYAAQGDKAAAAAKAIEIPNVEALKTKLNSVEANNRKVRDNQAWQKLDLTVVELEEMADEATEKLQQIVAQKEKQLADLVLPISGLKFNESGCYLGEVPFDQGSDKDQWKACIEVATLLNPNLCFLYIRRGGLLTPAAREEIFKMADAKGYQVLFEVPGTCEDATIIMEDGVSREVNNEKEENKNENRKYVEGPDGPIDVSTQSDLAGIVQQGDNTASNG